jgi:hypothetical protein
LRTTWRSRLFEMRKTVDVEKKKEEKEERKRRKRRE